MLRQMQFDEANNEWNGLLAGELDAVQAPKLIASMESLLEQHPAGMRLNCEHLDFVDSMGLGALVRLRKLVTEHGGAMRLTNMKKRIYKLFVITGLEDSFGIEVEQ